MEKLTGIDLVTFALVIVGAVNWGLVGLFDIDVIALLFGQATILARIAYALVGVAGLYLIYDAAQLGHVERTARTVHQGI